MRKAVKFSLILFGVFFAFVFVALIMDISNDVEYEVVEEEVLPTAIHLKVSTEATDEESLRIIADEVQDNNRDKEVEIVFLLIYDTADKLLAKVDIPYNDQGKIRAGADSLEYVFEMK